MSRGFRDLKVWQKGMLLAKNIYTVTETFPKTQMFVLANQMQRAALSIPSNIAEGYNRRSPKEYAQFLSIAYGSGGELETQILLAVDLGYIGREQSESLFALLAEICKMLHVMIHKP